MGTSIHSGMLMFLLIAGFCIGFIVLIAFLVVYLIKKNK